MIHVHRPEFAMQNYKMAENQVEQFKRESNNPPREKKFTKRTDLSKLQNG